MHRVNGKMNEQVMSIHVSSYRVKGVSVKKYMPVGAAGRPVVMVHGGAHGGWVWDGLATYLSERGWECHALDWYNHGDSAKLPENDLIKRGIADVAQQEIRHVVDGLHREPIQEPILLGHSMGGLASLAYAEKAPVAGLVLLTPVMPASVKPDPIPLQVDRARLFGPFPPELAKRLFFTTLDSAFADHYQSLLVPESPRAVFEATQWTVSIDLGAVQAQALVFAAELDSLTPAVAVGRMARMMGARYELVPGIGHSDILLKDPERRQVAESINAWLSQRLGRPR
jgi:pimeloyl-ACP methyl ester carboxylesterase